jgi:heme/copper-type cytochrome/quinol oxidase subunit 2
METKRKNQNLVRMETKSNTFAFNRKLLFMFMVIQSFWLQAQEPGVSKKIVSGDQMNSLYIIGSVLVFGVIAYFVYSMIDKNRRAREEDKPQTRRPASHRHHHHHRVIKKSA